jgi:hypothetical protein
MMVKQSRDNARLSISLHHEDTPAVEGFAAGRADGAVEG